MDGGRKKRNDVVCMTTTMLPNLGGLKNVSSLGVDQ